MVDEQITSSQKKVMPTEPIEAVPQASSAQQAYRTSIVTNKAISCFTKTRQQDKEPVKSHHQARVIDVGQVITYTKSGTRAYGHMSKHIPKNPKMG